jgi:hypothetical protein
VNEFFIKAAKVIFFCDFGGSRRGYWFWGFGWAIDKKKSRHWRDLLSQKTILVSTPLY